MMPSIRRTLDKFKYREGGVSIGEFRSSLLHERIRKEDVSHIIKELRANGVLDIKHRKIELR
jgi:hypothetical protein